MIDWQATRSFNWARVGKILLLVGFVFHIALTILVIIATFLPFNEDENFYASFNGFFGNVLGGVHPFIILAFIIAATVISFFAIKKNHLWIATGILTFIFFLIAMLPYSLEVAFVSMFSAIGGDVGISDYGIGFKIMSYASNAIYFDAFMIASSILCSIMAGMRNDL